MDAMVSAKISFHTQGPERMCMLTPVELTTSTSTSTVLVHVHVFSSSLNFLKENRIFIGFESFFVMSTYYAILGCAEISSVCL
jgi:hypothetical protein